MVPASESVLVMSWLRGLYRAAMDTVHHLGTYLIVTCVIGLELASIVVIHSPFEFLINAINMLLVVYSGQALHYLC